MLDLTILSGRVVDETGAPLRQALVGAKGDRDCSVTRTNAEGRFSLGLIAAEPVRVMARKRGFLLGVQGGIDPNAQDLQMVLHRSTGLHGTLAGDRPRRYEVKLRRFDGARFTASVHRAKDGSFSASRMPAGVYELEIQAKGYVMESPVVLDLQAGEELIGLQVELRRVDQ